MLLFEWFQNVVVVHRFFSCLLRKFFFFFLARPCGLWDFNLWPGSKPLPHVVEAHGVEAQLVTAGPPGKSYKDILIYVFPL